jgi:hypothetical protein
MSAGPRLEASGNSCDLGPQVVRVGASDAYRGELAGLEAAVRRDVDDTIDFRGVGA